MKVEVLHFGGCPGSSETLALLRKMVAEEEITVEVSPVVLGPYGRPDFPDSPTILVDGEDLFPIEHHGTHAISCRIYATSRGPKNHPTATMLHKALLKHLPA